MTSHWWGQIVLGFFIGIGFAAGTALFRGILALFSGGAAKQGP